jgi:hypothetical protein
METRLSDIGTPEPWHDPELPFLEVLGREIRYKAERAAGLHEQRLHPTLATQRRRLVNTDADAALRPTRARVERDGASRDGASRLALRMGRRSLMLMALLCLLGATAYGAGLVLSSTPQNPLAPGRSAFTLVASGGSGSAGWKLQLYTRGSEVCRVLSVAETEASACAERPSAGQLEATSAEGPSDRYVFGVVGEDILRVRVRIGHQTRMLATLEPSAAQRRRADLPAHVRYYVAMLRRFPTSSDPSALVEGLDFDGRPLGSPVPSCVETGEPGRC